MKRIMRFLFTALLAIAPLTALAEPIKYIETYPSRVIDNREIECLARNIYFESRDQPIKGMLAVGFVTINRTKDSEFPPDICGVVYQKGKNGCAFSWNCDHRKDVIEEHDVWNIIYFLARTLYLDHDHMEDPTHGALYFRSGVSPKTRFYRSVRIGDHVFYQERR